MAQMSWLLAVLFLPLFPFSMIFNLLWQRCTASWLRVILLLLWPLPGLWLLQGVGEIPVAIQGWALLSAVLYAFRALVVREFSIWMGFVAVSAWALLWLGMPATQSAVALAYIESFSLPLALLALLVAEVEQRHGAAYAGVVSALAANQPRLAAMLVLAVLAVIASPVFPAFFMMLANIASSLAQHPLLATGEMVVWLLWSWSAMRLLQALLVGPAVVSGHRDISARRGGMYALTLVLLAGFGLFIFGGQL